eukprot:547078_1
MSQLSSLRFTPTNGETNGIFDLSWIVDKYDTYSKGSHVKSNEFVFCDLQFRVNCYPKGNTEAKSTDHVSLYFEVLNGTVNDERQLEVSMESGNIKRQFTKPVHQFVKGNYGWHRCKTYQQFKQCSTVSIKIKFHQDPFFDASTTSNTFVEQHERMYKLSELHGDVTLIIKLPRHNDTNSNNGLYQPSNKKRRLNDPYRCSVCDREFQSQQGLKIHQANKKDEAHTNYKNTNKEDDTDSGLDCGESHEIKISSLILRSASNVFDRMLDTNMREQQENRIEIEAKCTDDVKAMAYFMCTNVLKSDCNAFDIIALAHYYEMDTIG